MVPNPLCPLYKNFIKPLDRARYPELRYKLINKRLKYEEPCCGRLSSTVPGEGRVNFLRLLDCRTEILVPFAAIQAVPFAMLAWYRLQRYVWYRYCAIVI